MKKKKKIRKNRVISTVIPLVIIIFLGGIIGNKMASKNKKQDNVLNNFNNEEKIDNTNKNSIIPQNTDVDNNKVMENNILNIENEKKEDSEVKNVVNTSNEKKENSSVKFDETIAFIGDSRTQGFIMYNGLKDVQDYSYIGLTVDTAISKKFVKTNSGEKITLLQDMKERNIEKVYIMLGVNELGWSYPQVFKSKYKELIHKIREVNNKCEIYVQSIIPVTKSRDKSEKYFNNIRIKQYNQLIKEVAKEENVKYLDVQSVLVNSEGYLPEETSPDGIHIGKSYCEKWLDYLKNNF